MKWILVLTILVSLISCGAADEKKNDDPDDESKKNGEYIWWIDDAGIGEWIKKGEDGLWKPTDGVLTDYHENGEVMLIENYINGKVNGMRISFDDEADTLMKMHFNKGVADSLFQYFYKNGKVYLEMSKSESKTSFNEITINYPSGGSFSKFKISSNEYGKYDLDSVRYFHVNGSVKYLGFKDSLLIYNSEGELLLSCGAFEGLTSITNSSDMASNLIKDNNVFVRDLPNFGCLEGDCQNGYGEYISPASIIYKGNFKNGFYEGDGKLFSLDGDLLCESSFYLGLPTGFGKLRYPEMKYLGELYCGLKHGEGRVDYEEVAFEGVFDYGKLNGKVYMFQEGYDSIVAHYKDDLEHGVTMLYTETGEVVEQKYLNGIMESEKVLE